MRKHTCHLDLRQRSRYVTIGLQAKFHWVLQLINNQKEKLFQQSQEEVSRQAKFFQPTQPIQNQSVIDQGNLITNTKCLLIKAKHPGLDRSRRNLFTKNSVLQIDQGNLISRLA